MSRNRTPSPDVNVNLYGWGCAVIMLPCLLVLLALCSGFEFMLLFAMVTLVPAVVVIIYWLYGHILLWMCKLTLSKRGIRGILVYSSSPNWQEYIETNWLPVFDGRFCVLNRSERHRWGETLPVRVYRHFCRETENYCPAILLFRGLRHPYVYRCFYAFRDHKHGNEKALREIEEHLFQLIR